MASLINRGSDVGNCSKLSNESFMSQENASYSSPMKIPYEVLSPAALAEVIEEFVTRDGTDQSSESKRVVDVEKQLNSGIVEIHFDTKTGTCNIIAASLD